MPEHADPAVFSAHSRYWPTDSSSASTVSSSPVSSSISPHSSLSLERNCHFRPGSGVPVVFADSDTSVDFGAVAVLKAPSPDDWTAPSGVEATVIASTVGATALTGDTSTSASANSTLVPGCVTRMYCASKPSKSTALG